MHTPNPPDTRDEPAGERASRAARDEPPGEHASQVTRNARIGLSLFAVYVALYAVFMYLAAFRSDLMASTTPLGVNLAITCGFGLIAAALVLAVVYLFLTARSRPR